MTLPPNDRALFRLRQEETELDRSAATITAEARATQAALETMLRTRPADRARVQAARQRLAQFEIDLRDVTGKLAAIRDRIRDWGRIADPLSDDPIKGLAAHTPVLLLPVRIETRYAEDGKALLVRIYPDQLHIDTHEEPLTLDELTAGQFYWHARWADDGKEVSDAAFVVLAQAFRPRRAAWIAFATRPTNWGARGTAGADPFFTIPQSRETAWTRAALATLLPTRWIVTGYVEDKPGNLVQVFQAATKTVAHPLHAGPDPADTTEPVKDDAGRLLRPPLDDGMLWATDFAAAVDKGMAVRIPDSAIGDGIPAVSRTFSRLHIARLTVHGANTDLSAGEAADRLEALLRAHRYSDGIAMVRPGTPTNNGDADAGFDSSDAAQIAAIDPASPPRSDADTIAALASALGIDAQAAHLDRIDGGSFRDAETTRRMIGALWFATLGQTLDQFFDEQFSDIEIARLRDFAAAHLRPGGPLPTLRIGRQPYGILPVMASAGYATSDPVEAQVDRAIRAVRKTWVQATARVPVLAKPGQALADNMRELLQHQPLAAHNRFRRVLGPGAVQNANIDKQMAKLQEGSRQEIFKALGVTPKVRMASVTIEAKNRNLGAPFVQAKIVDETAPLSPNYLSTIALESTLKPARDRLAKHGAGPSLLEALLGASLVYTYDHAIWYTLFAMDAVVAAPAQTTARTPRNAVMRTAEFIGVEPVATPAARRGQPVQTAVHSTDSVATMTFPAFTGTLTIADFVTAEVTAQVTSPALTDHLGITRLKNTVADVRALEHRPAAELDRVFRGILDAYSHRLDAWITALATARLQHWRKQAPARGIAIGGFGWVEKLFVDKKPDSDGYIHAPSLHHAHTAAVLRSGHLTHADQSGAALAIDLSSRRVRLAQGLLEGVGNGQPLAALLGYRFERMLREADIMLAQYILPIRRLFPLNPTPGETTSGQQEAIAARDVVDGVKLMARRREPGDWLQGANPAVPPGARAKIETVAAAIDDMFDAVKDLLIAEGVHQLVGGNIERAAAALAGLDRQARPVDPEVVRTLRTGRSFAQRAGVLLVGEDAGAWTGFAGGRALAEPRLNAWVARLLGKPETYRFGGTLVLPDGTTRALDPVTLAELALDPLSVLMMAQGGGGGRVSELQERIAGALALQVSQAEQDANAELHLHGDDPSGGGIGLAALEALLNRIRAVATRHRAATANDLAPPGTEAAPGARADVLEKRADQTRDAIEAAVAELGDAIGPGDPDPGQLAAALDVLSRAGVAGATPASGDGATLAAQASDAISRGRDGLTAQAKVVAAGGDPVEVQVARLKAMLGAGFPVLPPFAIAPGQADVFASMSDGAALTGKAPAILHGWLARMAEVKPRLGDLAGCLCAADLLTGGLADLRVAQLPHVAGARWIGLTLDKTTPEQVDLSLVVHAPGLDPASPPALFAGLMSDEWTETVPNADETTGIAFNYDAPGARAPQTMLLAVHPDPAASAWRPSQILASINAAADLARIRAVRPQDIDTLGSILPMVYLPDSFATGSGVDFAAMASAVLADKPSFLVNVLGKG